MKCERCGVQLDKHTPNKCLDAWIMSCQGYKVVELSPGDKRLLIRTDGTFSLLNVTSGQPVDEYLYLEIHSSLIPSIRGLDKMREVFDYPCVTPVPAFVSSFDLDNSHRLVDFIRSQPTEIKDMFFAELKTEIEKEQGAQVADSQVIFRMTPTTIARAFIRTRTNSEINKIPGSDIKNLAWVKFAF